MASDDEIILASYPTASAAAAAPATAAAPWRPHWASAPASAYSYNSSRSSDDSGPAPGNTATP
eukprot:scaffold46351_cov66-Phaeocystis_antarctica.AAC.1